MKRTRTLGAVGVVGLALALTSCLKMDMDLTVNTNDTVDGTVIMGFSKEMSDLMGEEAGSMDEMMDGLLNMDLGDEEEDVTVEPYEDDTYVGQQVTFEETPLDEMGSEEDFSLARDGEEFVFDGQMDMSEDGEGMGDVPPGLLESMMEDFDVQISVTFPGEVLEHNGDLSGTTVTWEPEFGETNDMFARASETGGGGDGVPAWLWIVIAVVVLAGLAGLIFMFARGRGEAAPAAAGAAQPPGPPGGAAEVSEPSMGTTTQAAAAPTVAPLTPDAPSEAPVEGQTPPPGAEPGANGPDIPGETAGPGEPQEPGEPSASGGQQPDEATEPGDAEAPPEQPR